MFSEPKQIKSTSVNYSKLVEFWITDVQENCDDIRNEKNKEVSISEDGDEKLKCKLFTDYSFNLN